MAADVNMDIGYSRYGLLTLYANYWRQEDRDATISLHIRADNEGYALLGEIVSGDGHDLKSLTDRRMPPDSDSRQLALAVREFARSCEETIPFLNEVLSAGSSD